MSKTDSAAKLPLGKATFREHRKELPCVGSTKSDMQPIWAWWARYDEALPTPLSQSLYKSSDSDQALLHVLRAYGVGNAHMPVRAKGRTGDHGDVSFLEEQLG